MNFMGIDIGTSGCKAIVFSESGEQLAHGMCSYDIQYTDGGGVELDSGEVILKCFEVIRDCTSQVERGSVRGLSISSQGEAFTAVGHDNEMLCNAMVSSDTRSDAVIGRFLKRFDEERLYRITGHTAHPLHTLFKLIWLKENRPGIWSETRQFLCFEELLQMHLGLKPSISWPLAGRTMMFDVTRHEWSPEILDEVGLDAGQLAEPRPSGSVIGRPDPEIARELGLPEDVQVVAGGHDQVCSALGAGVIREGSAMLATGTVECIAAAFREPVFSTELRKSNLCTYDYTLNGWYATCAFHLTGGNILKWFKEEFGAAETAEAARTGGDVYELLLKNLDSRPSSLLSLPYFTSSGTPYFDTKTRGALLGMRLSTGREDIMRALLEGVSLEMRLNLELLHRSGYRIGELRMVGGGAKSADWVQLKADVMDRRITTLNITEAGCFGAAMLACSAVTGRDTAEIASGWVRPLRTVEPRETYRDWYADRFELYQKMYHAVKTIHIPEFKTEKTT